MYYNNIVVLVIMAATLSCAKPNLIIQNFEAEQIVHCSEISTIENLSDYVFYLDKGEMIPLRITLDSDIADIAVEEINLVLKQKMYFRLKLPGKFNADYISSMNEKEKERYFENIMIYLSPDAKRWAPYTDIKSVEQVLNIKGGAFSFGIGITKKEGIQVFVGAKTNKM